MKYTLCLVILLATFVVNAQKFENDTIQLNEVRLKNYKPKIRSRSIRGFCTSYEHLQFYREIITLVDNLPKGYLHSVTFDFNNKFDKSMTYDFQDTEIEVLFYTVKPDNTPGEKIIGKKLMINKEHRGKKEIDVSDLNLKTNGKLYIGVKRITIAGKTIKTFEIHGICMGNKKHTAYCRKKDNEVWKKTEYASSGLKMKVKVEVQ